MDRWKQYVERWKRDYDFKTLVAAFGSLAVTVLFGLYNGVIGLIYSSAWHGSICAYYLMLIALRGLIVAAEEKDRDDLRRRVYRVASVLLLILNLALIAPIAIMVRQEKPVSMTLIPAIAMAAYTTYKIVMASVNQRRKSRTENKLIRLLRSISFIDALVSILTLQNTLIMVNSKDGGSSMIPLTSVTSGAIWLLTVAVSAVNFARCFRKGDQGG